MTNINLTIIIPYKDIANYLERLLESIFLETNEIYTQIIVVNDHSSKQLDEYRSIQERYKNKVLFLENNSVYKGAGAARNIGLRCAAGKWLLFADSDDFFVKGWYSIIKQYFQSDSDIIYFKPTSCSVDNNIISKRHANYAKRVDNLIKYGDQKSEDCLRYGFVVPWSKLIRKEMVLENGIHFDEVMYSNDNMFSTRIGKCAKDITPSSECIYCVTKRSDSLIADESLEALKQRTLIRCNQYQYVLEAIGRKRLNQTNIGELWIFTLRKVIKLYKSGNCDLQAVKQILSILHKNTIRIIIPRKYLKRFFNRILRKIKRKS